MFISKKKYEALEKRIADLEGQVQSQQIALSALTINADRIHTNIKP